VSPTAGSLLASWGAFLVSLAVLGAIVWRNGVASGLVSQTLRQNAETFGRVEKTMEKYVDISTGLVTQVAVLANRVGMLEQWKATTEKRDER